MGWPLWCSARSLAPVWPIAVLRLSLRWLCPNAGWHQRFDSLYAPPTLLTAVLALPASCCIWVSLLRSTCCSLLASACVRASMLADVPADAVVLGDDWVELALVLETTEL